MTNQHDATTNDIMEFLKEHMVVKADFDTRFKGVDTRLDGIDTRLDGVDARLNGIDTRLNKMDVKLESLDSRFAEFQLEIEDIKIKLSAIETRLKEDTDALNNVLITEVAGLKKRVMFLEQKLGLAGLDFKGAAI